MQRSHHVCSCQGSSKPSHSNVLVVLLQLPTQLYTAVLYSLITVLLFAQHMWYSTIKPRIRRKVRDAALLPVLPPVLLPVLLHLNLTSTAQQHYAAPTTHLDCNADQLSSTPA
jgi:hypothetical protein